MILTLSTYNFLFASSPIKYYVVEHNDNPDIEEINYLGEELDLNDPESYDLAIEFLNDCKEYDRKICDACKYPSLLGAFFGSNFNKIYDTINDTADTLIDLLTRKKNTLHTDEDLSCKTCCSCSGTDYCKTCQEVNASEVEDVPAVENVKPEDKVEAINLNDKDVVYTVLSGKYDMVGAVARIAMLRGNVR